MKYAIIDTETTGLFDFSKPADAEGQPRMASLAIVKLEENLDAGETHLFYIKPDGWEMPEAASKINGLTTDYLMAHGEPVRRALDAYTTAIDEGYVIASYGVDYDLKILRGELRRADAPDLYEQTQKLCLMRVCTPICQIPRAKGKGWKFPKLAEACEHFGIDRVPDHTALNDAEAAASILLDLEGLGKLPAPTLCKSKQPA